VQVSTSLCDVAIAKPQLPYVFINRDDDVLQRVEMRKRAGAILDD